MFNNIKKNQFGLRIKDIKQSLVPLDDIRSSDIISFFLKRIFDISLSVLSLLIVGLPMMIIMVLIKLDSPGSVFFSQTRIGLKGKPFKLLKLRTMVKNAAKIQTSLETRNEVEGGVLFKIKEDPRITRVGKFLRRYSIDEIPQLINVIKGEMSLVGPRPLTLRDSAKLHRKQLTRTEVLPGITGFWQVSGRSQASSDDLARCDRFYVEKWSLSLDFLILLKTIFVVISGEGAY
jgi:lipopolysaccharide/colanic/teichoic acid biosynthesis glycosyltransferase